jgi:UDP-N-acetylglucosamine 2-epimerase
MRVVGIKIVFVLGTRPEIIRLSPMIRYLQNDGRRLGVDFFVIHSGQHYDYEMDSVFFDDLEMRKPKYNLGVGSGSHAEQTYKMVVSIEKILKREKPEFTIIFGDTNTGFAGALASAKLQIPVVHVEAGCRAFDMSIPEEINRVCIDHVSRLLFPPDKVAYDNLVKEGVDKSLIYLLGNPLVDACLENYELGKKKSKIFDELGLKNGKGVRGEYAILTLHRAGNVDNKEVLKRILEALVKIDVPIVFPIHPRTKKMVEKFGFGELLKRFIVTKPLGYLDFLMLMGGSKAVFTDSGGVQVEANILGKPCIVLRDRTEWVLEMRGMSRLVYDDKKLILEAYKSVCKIGHGAEKTGFRKLDYSWHKGSSKKIMNKCIELHKKEPLKMWKKD